MTAVPADLRKVVDALQTQIDFLREDLQEGEKARVVFALQSLRFLASRLEEALTQERVDDMSRVAYGPPVRRRVDGSILRSAIVEILEEAGRPLLVREIMGELETRGIGVPGKGRPANIVSHLSRMAHVTRVEYGTYALATTLNE